MNELVIVQGALVMNLNLIGCMFLALHHLHTR